MSYDTSTTHDTTVSTTNASATSAPGKRTATAGLSAPVNRPQATGETAASTSTSSALHGTGWLAGVLGFGGDATGDCECEDHHDKDKHNKHKKHHDEPLLGGGGGSTGVEAGAAGDCECEDHHDKDKDKHKKHKKHHHDAPLSGGGEGVVEREGGDGAASGDCECDEPKHKKHKKHHDAPLSGGGEGVAELAGEEGDAPKAEGRSESGIPPILPPPKKDKDPVKITTRTVKAAPDGSKARTTVGVGELVHFTGSKAGTWSASAGSIRHGIKESFFYWEAMDRRGNVLITLKAGNTTVTEVIQVVAPTTLQMVKFAEDSFPRGEQGAGMRTNVTIGPSSVCFGAVEWLEVPGGPSSISGYWTHNQAPNHHPNPKWLPWNDNNTGLTDHAALWGAKKPWSPGGFTWYIPNKYRVNGKGDGEVFIHTHQVFHMTNTKGTTTITKGGAGVTRTP